MCATSIAGAAVRSHCVLDKRVSAKHQETHTKEEGAVEFKSLLARKKKKLATNNIKGRKLKAEEKGEEKP